MPPVWDTAANTQGYLKERQVTNNLQKTLLDNIMQRARLNETVNSRIAQMGQRQKDRDLREKTLANEMDFKRSESASRIEQSGIARDFSASQAEKGRDFQNELFGKRQAATTAREDKLFAQKNQFTTNQRAYEEKIRSQNKDDLKKKENRAIWEGILKDANFKATPKQIDTAMRTGGLDEVIRLSSKKDKQENVVGKPDDMRKEIDSIVSKLSKATSPNEINRLNSRLSVLNKSLGYSEEKQRKAGVEKVLKGKEKDLGVKLDALMDAGISPRDKEYIKVKNNYMSGMKGLEKSVSSLRKSDIASQRNIEDELDISSENVTGGFIQGDFWSDPISKFVPGWKKVIDKRIKSLPKLDKWVTNSDEFVSAMNDEAKRISNYLLKENYAEGINDTVAIKLAEAFGWVINSKRMIIYKENKRIEVENNIYNLLLDAYGSDIGK